MVRGTLGARHLAIASVAALLFLRPDPAGAGCCDTASGCFDTDDETLCTLEFGGTLLPDPAFCSVATVPPQCESGEPGSTTTTSSTSTSTLLPGSTTTSTTTLPWPGYQDGRLSPDPSEDYAVWCSSDRVEVWRTVPLAVLLKAVIIRQVIDLAVGDELDLGSSMVVERTSEDVVTISGSNGNSAPQPGSKTFSLSECIARNGGDPEPSPPSGPEGEPPPGPPEWEFCFTSYDFFDGDTEIFIDCMNGYAVTVLERCWVFLMAFELDELDRIDPVPPAARPAGGSGADFNFLALYLDLTLLRDGAFAETPGGRRATDLYHAHSGDFLHATARNPAVLTTAQAALEAWAPVVASLVHGDGASPTVSAAQAQAFDDFLTAVRAGASQSLTVALEREVLLVDPASFVGLTPRQMIERLERLSCEPAATLPSLRCRLEDLGRVVDTHVEPKTGKRLASRLGKASKQVERAEGAADGEKRREKALGRLGRILAGIERSLEKRRVVARVGEEVRLVLGDGAAAIQADAQALLDQNGG
jgi:hypothetical protein